MNQKWGNRQMRDLNLDNTAAKRLSADMADATPDSSEKECSNPDEIKRGIKDFPCLQGEGKPHKESLIGEDRLTSSTFERLAKEIGDTIGTLIYNIGISDTGEMSSMPEDVQKEIAESVGGDITRDMCLLRDQCFNRDLAENLFQLKGLLLKGKFPIPAKFVTRMAELTCYLLLSDKDSPGVIDEAEAHWLRSCMQKNREIDQIDRIILEELRKRSLNYPDILDYKTIWQKRVEKCLSSFQLLTWMAILGSLSAACVLFVGSTISLIKALFQFLGIKRFAMPSYVASINPEVEGGPIESVESLVQCLVASVDEYLFAMVLLIFGIGIYSLFISKRDTVDENRSYRPKWLHVASIDDLKSSLGNSILMALIVAIYRYALTFTANDMNKNPANLLYFSGAIVLVAYALHLVHSNHSGHTHSTNPPEKGQPH